VSCCLNLAKYFRQQMANKVVLVTDKQLHIALLQRLMLCLSDLSEFWLWVVANLSYRAWPYFFLCFLPGFNYHLLVRYPASFFLLFRLYIKSVPLNRCQVLSCEKYNFIIALKKYTGRCYFSQIVKRLNSDLLIVVESILWKNISIILLTLFARNVMLTPTIHYDANFTLI